MLCVMSDTDAMVRLMEHAADKLSGRLADIGKLSRLDNPSAEEMTAIVAAMAYARAVLQMTAASVAPENSGAVRKLIDRLAVDYHEWADEFTQTEMTDGELAAIGRFLRWAMIQEKSS